VFEQHLQHGGVIVMTSHHDISLPAQDLQRLQLGQAA
jgi:ABC-type transport system involved in cytochrome c biogenesis ATPase subunit